MGQMTHGVLYGAKIAELDDEQGLLYEALWEFGADIVYIEPDELAPGAPPAPPPYWLAGFWLAVGASGKEAVPFLETVQLSEIPAAYSERYDAAKAAWPQVEAAVAAAGVKDFAPPSLWIAETEVA